MTRWYASVDGGRSAFSVDADTREEAHAKAHCMCVAPNPDTHPGFFFETRANPLLAARQARALTIYTTQEWDAKEHDIRRREGVFFPGDKR